MARTVLRSSHATDARESSGARQAAGERRGEGGAELDRRSAPSLRCGIIAARRSALGSVRRRVLLVAAGVGIASALAAGERSVCWLDARLGPRFLPAGHWGRCGERGYLRPRLGLFLLRLALLFITSLLLVGHSGLPSRTRERTASRDRWAGAATPTTMPRPRAS